MEIASREIQRIADWLAASRSTVVLTGAGISTESGIPDFRSPGGVWSKYRTVYFDEFLASAESRYEYWRQKCEMHRDFADAQPNAGHNNSLAGNRPVGFAASSRRISTACIGSPAVSACLSCTARLWRRHASIANRGTRSGRSFNSFLSRIRFPRARPVAGGSSTRPSRSG